jgi:hypothetical protein
MEHVTEIASGDPGPGSDSLLGRPARLHPQPPEEVNQVPARAGRQFGRWPVPS